LRFSYIGSLSANKKPHREFEAYVDNKYLMNIYSDDFHRRSLAEYSNILQDTLLESDDVDGVLKVSNIQKLLRGKRIVKTIANNIPLPSIL
jgi:hypothetical protein